MAMNPVMCNDSDGVIKDQQIANLSIENVIEHPLLPPGSKENAYVYLLNSNNGSERAGIYAEITAIFKKKYE